MHYLIILSTKEKHKYRRIFSADYWNMKCKLQNTAKLLNSLFFLKYFYDGILHSETLCMISLVILGINEQDAYTYLLNIRLQLP